MVTNDPQHHRQGDSASELTLAIGWGAVSRVDLEPATCSLRRVCAFASELGSDVSGIELEFADNPLAASYQLAALCPLNALDSQRLLEASSASNRLDLARAMLDERAELLRVELSAS